VGDLMTTARHPPHWAQRRSHGDTHEPARGHGIGAQPPPSLLGGPAGRSGFGGAETTHPPDWPESGAFERG
jgi:hypothetical protein